MKVSIIPSDNVVVVDGVPRRVDCSSVPPEVHAVQWQDAVGVVEYVDDDPNDGQAPAPQRITSLGEYQALVDAWQAAKAAEEAAK